MTVLEATRSLTDKQLALACTRIVFRSEGTEKLSDAFVEALLMEAIARGLHEEADRLAAAAA